MGCLSCVVLQIKLTGSMLWEWRRGRKKWKLCWWWYDMMIWLCSVVWCGTWLDGKWRVEYKENDYREWYGMAFAYFKNFLFSIFQIQTQPFWSKRFVAIIILHTLFSACVCVCMLWINSRNVLQVFEYISNVIKWMVQVTIRISFGFNHLVLSN